MKTSAEFECDCKEKTTFDFTLPDVWAPVLVDVVCKGCQSTWVVKFRQTVKGGTHFTYRLKTKSQKLRDLKMKKKYDEIANRPQLKDPKIYVPPGFKT